MIILYFCMYVRIIPEENTTLSQSSLLLPVCSSAGKGCVGKYTVGVSIPIRWAVQQLQLEGSKNNKWSKYNAFKAKHLKDVGLQIFRQSGHFVFLLPCPHGLSKVLFATSNEKLRTGYFCFTNLWGSKLSTQKMLRSSETSPQICWLIQLNNGLNILPDSLPAVLPCP